MKTVCLSTFFTVNSGKSKILYVDPHDVFMLQMYHSVGHSYFMDIFLVDYLGGGGGLEVKIKMVALMKAVNYIFEFSITIDQRHLYVYE